MLRRRLRSQTLTPHRHYRMISSHRSEGTYGEQRTSRLVAEGPKDQIEPVAARAPDVPAS